jgi:hypothetical protein
METRFSKNSFVKAVLVLLCALFSSGCLIADKQTVEMTLLSSQEGAVRYIYYGIKSDSDQKDEITEDFDSLTAMVSEESRASAYTNDKIKIERWDIDTDAEGVVYGAVDGTFNIDEFFGYNDYKISNKEILITLPIVKNQKLTSNGKVMKTENNYILVWPRDTKDLQWTIDDKNSLKYPNNLSRYFTP